MYGLARVHLWTDGRTDEWMDGWMDGRTCNDIVLSRRDRKKLMASGWCRL